jgi:hypothetical protein
MTESRVDRHRQLSAQIGEQPARALLDRLQGVALTQPESLRESEALIERGRPTPRLLVFPKPDRRHNPDGRITFVIPARERRRPIDV